MEVKVAKKQKELADTDTAVVDAKKQAAEAALSAKAAKAGLKEEAEEKIAVAKKKLAPTNSGDE